MRSGPSVQGFQSFQASQAFRGASRRCGSRTAGPGCGAEREGEGLCGKVWECGRVVGAEDAVLSGVPTAVLTWLPQILSGDEMEIFARGGSNASNASNAPNASFLVWWYDGGLLAAK